MQLPEIPKSLRRVSSLIQEFAAPCVGYSLNPDARVELGGSKLGGAADLPADFAWPEGAGGPLDFLLQIDLAEASRFDATGLLPKTGLLTFFYDLEEQPWGFDPDDLEGFRVHYNPRPDDLQSAPTPRDEFALPQCRIALRSGLSLPHIGSRVYERFDQATRMSDEEFDEYISYSDVVEKGDAGGNHRLLGHPANVQNDMQLEAQLVMNGLYCGNATGYEDPRRPELEKFVEDWILLLQLDSDDKADLMWGDAGMLYFWIRKQDLAALRFDQVWMTLQCG